MQTQQHHWKFFQQHYVVSFVVRTSVATVFGLLFTVAPLGVQEGEVQVETRTTQAHALKVHSCSGNDHTYTAVRGDTLSNIARRSGLSDKKLALHNKITNLRLIYPGQKICIPVVHSTLFSRAVKAPSRLITKISHVAKVVRATKTSYPQFQARVAAIGTMNVFPYGTCTWYANQRYHQLHGVFVPWKSNANAWQWNARAYEYGWRVSHAPRVGSIIDLQGGVQGASWLGHVGVVEHVQRNGTIIASSMSWGANPGAVTRWQFYPGPGVTFINRN